MGYGWRVALTSAWLFAGAAAQDVSVGAVVNIGAYTDENCNNSYSDHGEPWARLVIVDVDDEGLACYALITDGSALPSSVPRKGSGQTIGFQLFKMWRINLIGLWYPNPTFCDELRYSDTWATNGYSLADYDIHLRPMAVPPMDPGGAEPVILDKMNNAEQGVCINVNEYDDVSWRNNSAVKLMSDPNGGNRVYGRSDLWLKVQSYRQIPVDNRDGRRLSDTTTTTTFDPPYLQGIGQSCATSATSEGVSTSAVIGIALGSVAAGVALAAFGALLYYACTPSKVNPTYQPTPSGVGASWRFRGLRGM